MRLRFSSPLIVFTLLMFALMPQAQAVPPIQQARLDNGLRVLLMEAHNVPMVAMQLLLPSGSRFDAAEKGGTASFLAAMLTDHTASHDDKAWAALLDESAIHLGAGADREGLSLSLTVLRESLEPGLDVLAEALLKPGWNGGRFDIIKQDSIAAAQKAQEEPREKVSQAAAKLLFGNHPYGHKPGGSLQSLPNIELADVQSLYKAQVKPQGAVLAVSGDITLAELVPLLQARLANWQGGPVKTMKDIAVAKTVVGEQVDVNVPTTQTLVQLLRLGPARSDADFFPVFVLNHILGGSGFASRLMEEVREKRGLVYGVYSYFVPLAVPGPFAVTLQTRNDQADQAEAVVRNLLAEMASGKITAKQMRNSKSNLIGGFAQRMDSNRERVGLLAMIGMYDLPLDYLAVWTERIEAVTLKQLRQQAAKYLDPEQWNRVRVGAFASP